ncbi:MAG: STAS domain-containing protein [Pirellulaceae bacterium]|nr:STAS domain-containing protein [Pirellulaceae bacterium]
MADIQIEKKNDVVMVYLRDLRLSNDLLAETIDSEINTLLNQDQVSKVIVNLRDVNFMNSTMIGKLVQLTKRCREESIDLRFCEIKAPLLEVFQLMSLPRIMQIHPTEESAFEAMA